MLTRRPNLRIPGVSFVPPAAPAHLALPPLDVAGFVGFAERGPLDWPIALSDTSEYRAIFGGDLALARDERGQAVYAQLPRAVAAFFANGGRRCYAVRVAGPGARPAQFTLPGVLALSAAGRPRLTMVDAASPGSWASTLRLAARLMIAPLARDTFRVIDSLILGWRTVAGAALAVGDVLRLTGSDGRRWLAPIAAITPAGSELMLALGGAWELVVGASLSPSPTMAIARRLTPTGTGPDIPGTITGQPGGLAVELTGPRAMELAQGDGISLSLGGTTELVAFVATLRRLRPSGSPTIDRVEATASELLRLGGAGLPVAPLRQIERLRLDLLPRLSQSALPTISDLAFNTGHPRFWGEQIFAESRALRGRDSPVNLATGEDLAVRAFRRLAGGLRPDPRDGPLDSMALSGLLAPLDETKATLIYLPLATLPIVSESDIVGPLAPGADDLDELTASCFLDGELAAAGRRGPYALLAEARERYDVQERRIYGLHSLITQPEVATLCVPDAAQLPWRVGGPAVAPDLPPALPPPEDAPCLDLIGPFEDCQRQPLLLGVNPAFGPVDGGTPVLMSGSGFDVPGPIIVRFGDRPATEVSVENDGALRCHTPQTGVTGNVDVTITTSGGEARLAAAFTYQAASTVPDLPTLERAASYDLATAPLLAVQRALIDVCRARGDAVALLSLPAHFERSDCLQWQEQLRIDFGLAARRGSGDSAEIADLSYAAVYHPWLLVRDDNAPNRARAIACDGAMAGMIAAREHERGVWIAPANLSLQGILGLTPALSDDDWAELFAQQFNLVRPEARDFRPMSAHTLSDERPLLQLSVRRLLIQLRKAVEELGLDFVFESNHERFREGVSAMLESMLEGLYVGGAFAGTAPAESYRVVTDASVNPPQSVELGRFVASIEVAPAQPAEFISVLLTRGDEGQIQATEG